MRHTKTCEHWLQNYFTGYCYLWQHKLPQKFQNYEHRFLFLKTKQFTYTSGILMLCIYESRKV